MGFLDIVKSGIGLTPIGAGLELIGGANRTLGNLDKIKELENRGVDIPFHQKFLPQILGGPAVGGRFQEASLSRKLERTGGVNIPTRPAIGLGGEAEFAQTANVFRQQLARQLGQQTTDLNREFNTAGRFDSGQRLEAIGRAQENAQNQFGQFLSTTALERFLQNQRNLTQLEVARIGADAQQPSRAGQVGGILSNIGQIFATNPEFFINLFRRNEGVGAPSLTTNTGVPSDFFDVGGTA